MKKNKVKRKIRGRRPLAARAIDLRAIGRRIRELRGRLNQIDLAAELGISQAQLSKYEQGKAAPALEVIVDLSLKFGKSTNWILTGRDP